MVKDKSLYVPANYELSQNYPNPFNPCIVRDFKVSMTSFLTIKFMIFLEKASVGSEQSLILIKK